MQSRVWIVILFIFFSVGGLLTLHKTAPPARGAAVIPPDFEDALVTSVGGPTALAFTPDGRLLITTQAGQVRIYKNGALLPTSALNISSKVCSNSERGLLGVAVDPDFANNHYIYLYYTFNKFNTCPTGQPTNASNPVNRVSRFSLHEDDIVEAASETVLIDNIVSANGNHNGGDVHFGKDGFLYVSVGDGGADYAGDSGSAGNNDAARDKHVMLGKILRIGKDGSIPLTNPHIGADSGRCNVTGSTTPNNWCQEIFATGLRNPFRIAFDSNAAGTRFFINDVGQGAWEEIDEGLVGADYGWNIREGHCLNGSTTNCPAPPAGLTNPIFDYQHTGNCALSGVAGNSITGGAFVPTGLWPAQYDGSYLFGEFVCGKIFRLAPVGGGGYAASEFATGLGGGSAVTMIFGPFQSSQALYYTTYASGGQVRRIHFTGSVNLPPTASVSATPSAGVAPLNVSFNASASSDPDGDPLTYDWNFGDGGTSFGATVGHTYNQVGVFHPIVTVNDGNGGTATASTRINVGTTNTPLLPGDVRLSFDFDGDNKTDLAIWRPSTGVWWILNSSTGGSTTTTLGTAGDVLTPGDYDGDGKTDVAVWRPSTGQWLIIKSSTGGSSSSTWGFSGDVPVPGDYDGDNKTDIAIWRPSTGVWWIIRSSTNNFTSTSWGLTADVPVPGDYDGDNRTDIAIWRPSTGVWWIIRSLTNTVTTTPWGTTGDVPIPGDYDGDGRADLTIWRRSTGIWWVLRSSTNNFTTTSWGNSGDKPVVGDYDGDNKADIAIWRPSTGVWWIIRSLTNTFTSTSWGTTGDVPIP